jgi:hypothetical protein
MKQRIENLSFEGVMIPIAEIEIVNCWASTSDNSAKTLHKVSSVRTIEGEELVTELNSYNHPFKYEGGNIFHEGMQSLSLYLSDPTT